MSPNANFRFTEVGVLSVEACEAPIVVTSAEIDERLAPFYSRSDCVSGAVQLLAGSHQRRQWPSGVSFTDAAAMAGQRAIAAAGLDPADIDVIIDTSVSRARLEPSSAVTVHHLLGLPPGCLNFDVSNACLGFLTGMHLAAVLIETGQVDHALIVDGEGTRELYDNTIERLNRTGAGLRDLIANFATFTLGSGAAAMVLGRRARPSARPRAAARLLPRRHRAPRVVRGDAGGWHHGQPGSAHRGHRAGRHRMGARRNARAVVRP